MILSFVILIIYVVYSTVQLVRCYDMPFSMYYERLADLERQIESCKRKMVKFNENSKTFSYYEEKTLSLEIEKRRTLRHMDLEFDLIDELESDNE